MPGTVQLSVSRPAGYDSATVPVVREFLRLRALVPLLLSSTPGIVYRAHAIDHKTVRQYQEEKEEEEEEQQQQQQQSGSGVCGAIGRNSTRQIEPTTA
jgi:hypothetical protein